MSPATTDCEADLVLELVVRLIAVALYGSLEARQDRPRYRMGTTAPVIIEHDVSRFPVEELDSVPWPVEEDVHTAVARVLSHSVTHYPGQRVEAFAHIRRLAVKEITQTVI